MYKSLFILFFIVPFTVFGQYYKSEKGIIFMVSNAPLEVIKAKSTALKGVVNAEKQEFAFSVEVNSFQGFNSPLQKEHFHENYMETKKFSTVTFKGKIIEKVDFSKNGKMTVRAKGWLEIHGIRQERIIKSELQIKDNKLIISTNFSVLLAEHQISIPKIVNQKIAEEIKINVNIDLSK